MSDLSQNRFSRSGGQLLALLLLAPVALVSLSRLARSEEPPPTAAHALASERAPNGLLLGSARAGERIVAVGEWGHVVLSDDLGETWRQAAEVPTRMSLTDVCFADEHTGWAVGHDAVVIRTRNSGEEWELQYAAPGEESPLLSVWCGSASRALAVGAFGLGLETTDGGRTWQRASIGADESDFHLNHLFRGPGGRGAPLFIAAESGHVYRSTDGGDSWRDLRPPYDGSFWGGLAVGNEALLVFGMRGHVFRSSDLGETWTESESRTDQSLSAGLELVDGTVILVGLGGTVLSSSDGGRTFTATTRPDRRGIAAVESGAPDRLILFGEVGVERTGIPRSDRPARQPR